MTYDAQLYDYKGAREAENSRGGVRATDVEAHEKEAAEIKQVEAFARGFSQGAREAVRDCIAVVEQQADYSGISNDDTVSGYLFWETVNKMNAALHALLEEGK